MSNVEEFSTLQPFEEKVTRETSPLMILAWQMDVLLSPDHYQLHHLLNSHLELPLFQITVTAYNLAVFQMENVSPLPTFVTLIKTVPMDQMKDHVVSG